MLRADEQQTCLVLRDSSSRGLARKAQRKRRSWCGRIRGRPGGPRRRRSRGAGSGPVARRLQGTPSSSRDRAPASGAVHRPRHSLGSAADRSRTGPSPGVAAGPGRRTSPSPPSNTTPSTIARSTPGSRAPSSSRASAPRSSQGEYSTPSTRSRPVSACARQPCGRACTTCCQRPCRSPRLWPREVPTLGRVIRASSMTRLLSPAPSSSAASRPT